MNTALVVIPGQAPATPPPRPAGPRLVVPPRPVEPSVEGPNRDRPVPWRGEPAERRAPGPRDGLQRHPAGEGSGRFARNAAPGETAASSLFMAQLLAQQAAAGTSALSAHRDGPALASESYRRAGGDPPLYSSDSAVFRFSV